MMANLIKRLFLALPDAVTSAIMLSAWLVPTVLGPEWVRNLALTVVIELFVMQSTLYYAVQKSNPEISRVRRIISLVILTAMYMIFMAYFSAVFHTVWPLIAFGWLFASRFVGLWTHPDLTNQDQRMMSLWLTSVVFYLGGMAVVALVPIPPLGFTPDFIASMDISDSGPWIAKPYLELAFGFLYFGALAWFKFHVTSRETGQDNKIYHRDDLDVATGKIRKKGSGSFLR
jgi:hypothetical protein